MLKKFFLYLVFLLFTIIPAVTGSPFSIRYLGINQGLSNSSVRCIFQDHDGYMWFGTYDGLNRYDGYSFKTFRNIIGDSSSLPHNYINAIGEDLHHNLVIGTSQGVSIYNSLKQQFTSGYYTPSRHTEKSRIRFYVKTIKADAKGNLYMATTGGGLLVKRNGSDIATQISCGKNSEGTCAKNVLGLVVDRQQRVWVVLAGAGLFQYLPATQQLQLVNRQLQNVRCMEADDAGNLLIGTYSWELLRYNIADNSIYQPYREQLKNINFESILSLAFDTLQHQLWIGTEGGGIGVLAYATGTVTNLLPGKGKNLLSGETVYTIYEDREHRRWIGTHKGGIDIIDPRPNPFQTISQDPLSGNSLVNNFVASFYEDTSSNLWIGTDGGGISVWNRTTNQFINYQHTEGHPQSLSNNSVPSIQGDYLGNIWVATFGGGIDRFQRATGTFQHYACNNPQTGGQNIYGWKLLEDRQHTLWAATYANGRLYRFNRQADQFELFSPEQADFFCLADDDSLTLWAGAAFGLCKIDKAGKKYTDFSIGKPVRAVYKDRQGRLWMGTEGLGLMLFDKVNNKIAANYTSNDGLCNNSILNILEDKEGNLWLSTFHGLAKFNPDTKTFKNYYSDDGLQSNQFEYNAALRLRSGQMAFGGINGFNLFSPDQLSVRTFNAPVLLTGLRINNTNVAEGSPYVTAMQPDGIAAVTIPYNEAVLSFDFAALEYLAPGKIRYAYYLEGWDKTWNYSSDSRTANYTRLGDGTYTLHIKATNAEGVWNPRMVQLRVVVLPPWYRSWWAYLLCVTGIAGLIYLYNGYRTRKHSLEMEVRMANLRSEKEKELAQLAIQNEKDLAEKKLTFFTDVAHEFRTPLTLIINPLKDYLESDQPQEKRELNVVYRNASRLLTLVNQLLQFKKAGSDTDGLRLVRLNFSHLCREVWASFEKSARLKHLNYQFLCSNENLELYGDREKLEVILYNLLSNALKFTPEEGEIVMHVVEKDETVEVKLTDNGLGIPPEVGNKLFERFYRVVQNGLSSKPGFGIGLYLVKYFVEKHQGAITYSSTPGVGTTFSLSFQKGLAHFAGLPVYEEVAGGNSLTVASIDTKTEPAIAEPGKNGLEELITSQKAILIVEDNDEIREYVSSLFSTDFTVYKAVSGNEGIIAAKKYLPDIIISDVMMENGSGIELCSTIKQDATLSHIPVILLTAASSSEMKLEGLESGADDYITKPFEKELLVARVVNLLKKRTILQNYFYNEVTLQQNNLKISPEYKEFLERCIAIVEVHLGNENFSIKTLSREIGMSHSSLYKKVKSISGQSVNAFIRFIRLRRAAELMIRTNSNVNEIAFEVGMNDIKHFRKQFHALFGMNPSEYIKKFRKPFSSTLTLKIEPGDDDK